MFGGYAAAAVASSSCQQLQIFYVGAGWDPPYHFTLAQCQKTALSQKRIKSESVALF